MEDLLIRIGHIDSESTYTISDGYIEINYITLEKFKTDKALNYLMQTLKKIELNDSTLYLINYLSSCITHLSLVDVGPMHKLTYDNFTQVTHTCTFSSRIATALLVRFHAFAIFRSLYVYNSDMHSYI
jgi:hypothetical protein